ncbi:MAG: hypothetical protein ACPIOQ_14880 [Promethearchaeia archaeon]
MADLDAELALFESEIAALEGEVRERPVRTCPPASPTGSSWFSSSSPPDDACTARTCRATPHRQPTAR